MNPSCGVDSRTSIKRTKTMDHSLDARLERGRDLLRRVGGANWDGPINRLARLSPAMSDFTVLFPYGDVLSRPGLDIRVRQALTVSILLANGSAQAQLRFHMNGLLEVGGSVDELADLLLLGGALVGFPTAIAAVGVVRSLIEDRGLTFEPSAEPQVDDRLSQGRAAMRTMLGSAADAYPASFARLSPVLARWTAEVEFGEMLAGTHLDPVARHLAIIVMLAASGNRETRLRHHILGARSSGISVDMIAEALIQLAAYAGFPAALNAFFTLEAALTDPVESAGGSADFGPASSEDRESVGQATMAATSGAAGSDVVHSFDDVAPIIGSLIVSHAYGDIFCRPGLDPKTRELTAIAALVGRFSAVAEGPVGVHVEAALAVGATVEEIVETVLNCVPYCGYPAVQGAMAVVGKTLATKAGD